MIPLNRNKWTACSGIGGRHAPDSVDGLLRNQWSPSTGLRTICSSRDIIASNMPSTTKKTRAVNIPGNPVGMQRYDLYKQAIAWTDVAIERGFYLEAISIIESMITDRLESYLSRVLGKDVSFQTLGPLIQTIRKEKITDEELRMLAITNLDEWRRKRNNSLHAMVKLEEGDPTTWEDRKKELPVIAEEGKEILFKVKKRIKYLQNKEKTKIREQKDKLSADERYKNFRKQMDDSYKHGTKK